MGVQGKHVGLLPDGVDGALLHPGLDAGLAVDQAHVGAIRILFKKQKRTPFFVFEEVSPLETNSRQTSI